MRKNIFSFVLDDKSIDELRQIAKYRRVSKSALVRMLIHDGFISLALKQEEQQDAAAA